MKKIVSGLLMGLFFVGCTEQETTYTIQGEWEGGDGKVVYLKKDLGDKKYEILDSAVVVKGSFKMQKPLGDVDERILEINGGTNIIILDSVPIHVKCETVKKMNRGKEVESVKAEISGSVEQDIFKTMLLTQRDEMLVMLGFSFMSKSGKENTAMQDSLGQMYLAVKARTAQTIDSLVTNYPDCHATALIIDKFVIKSRDLVEVEKMYESLTPRIKNAYLGRKLKTSIDNIKRTSIGNVAPDFTLPTPDGKNVSLSDYRGKIVLLDFWASWCGPCMREMPNVVKLYKECKGKNFEIVGVSLDQKRDAWLNAVEKNKMKWIQVSDLKSWATAPVKLCNVSAVPYTVLVDPDGKVIALDLRGEELIKKIKEVLKK